MTGRLSERRRLALVAAVFAVAPIPVVDSGYFVGVLSRILLFALFALALNIAFGHTDQLFLFVGGLGGVGAYTTALLADAAGVTAWVTLPVAALVCGALAASVSWIAARRRFTVVLIAILTLNIQLILERTFVGARSLTGGSTGFPYDLFSLATVADAVGVPTPVVLYYVVLAVLLAAMAVYVRLLDSKYGVAFAAIRADEVAAASIGIDVVRYKTVAGFLAGVIVGIAGTLLAREATYVTPSIFGFLAVDVTALVVLIVGGIRRTYGPIVGAVVVETVDTVLGVYAADWRTAIFGGLLVVLFLYFRGGVAARIGELAERHGLGSGRTPGDAD